MHPELLLFCLLGPEHPPKLLSTQGDPKTTALVPQQEHPAVHAWVLTNRRETPVWALACTLNVSTFWNS